MWSARPVASGIFPLDRELGLSASAFSPYVVEAIARLGTELPFERVPEMLSFFTQVGIGEETAWAVIERAGAVLQEMEEAAVVEFERGQRPEVVGAEVQQVSADGAMVHLVDEGWAGVKTLAIGKVEHTLGGDVHARDCRTSPGWIPLKHSVVLRNWSCAGAGPSPPRPCARSWTERSGYRSLWIGTFRKPSGFWISRTRPSM